jgi:outer membrane protein OmpA-like peptidoglycan-associated protein
VKALTAQYGIDPSRLVAKGYGETNPVAPNNSPDNMAKNRRVQLRKL